MEHYSPIEYIKMDIASAFGKDKLVWKDRLQWYEDNKNNLDFTKADEPARACAGIEALRLAEANQPVGFMCAMDATYSGLQMYGILLGCRNACLLTNAINSGRRVDGYTELYNLVKSICPNCDDLTRQAIKDAIMQYFYGGTKTAKETLGESGYNGLITIAEEYLPECNFMRNYLLDNWDPTVKEHNWIMPDNFHVNVPVIATEYFNFTYKGKDFFFGAKRAQPKENGKSLGANIMHSVDGFILREMVARCMYNQAKIDKLRKVQYSKTKVTNLSENTLKDYKAITDLLELGKKSGFYSTRILDYVNENNYSLVPEEILRDILNRLPEKRFDMMTVHDCFFCHPNYVQDMREQYRNCLVDLSKSNLMDFIFHQIFPNVNGSVGKTEDLTNEIAQEEYAIC